MRLHAFRAIRPVPRLAAQVAAVPYDVVDRSEAAELARGNPHSFLHVGRSDIDLPPDTDPHDPLIYSHARGALDELIQRGTLLRDDERSLYLYRQVMNGRTQTGLVGCVHIEDYETDVIRKHEKTRPDKEDDRTRHVLTLNAHAEPVFLAYRGRPEIDELTASVVSTAPLYDFTAPDGVRHTVWKIPRTEPWLRGFAQIPHGYVADGHHRSASAWRAGKQRRAANSNHTGDEEYNWFLAVLFPADTLTIMPYHRLVRDLAGQTPEAVLHRLGQVGRVSRGAPEPRCPGCFGVYLKGDWHQVALEESSIDRSDPIGSLDVSLLQDRILAPLLGVGDPRTDKRLEFVGGIRGTAELKRRVDSGEMAIAFALYPTTMEQLMAVSDAGTVMPPKSTWFEPKLRSGLFVHELD
ncbi:MAG TPA: DUF1015 family protein [Gemmatimonadales bacterium]